jgi:hypothetical protein
MLDPEDLSSSVNMDDSPLLPDHDGDDQSTSATKAQPSARKRLIRIGVLCFVNIVLWVANSVTFWTVGQRLPDYPYFVTWFTTTPYLILIPYLLLKRFWESEQQEAPVGPLWKLHLVYFAYGALSALDAIFETVANPYLTGVVETVVTTALPLPVTGLLAWWFLKQSFGRWEIIGSVVVLLASALQVGEAVIARPSITLAAACNPLSCAQSTALGDFSLAQCISNFTTPCHAAVDSALLTRESDVVVLATFTDDECSVPYATWNLTCDTCTLLSDVSFEATCPARGFNFWYFALFVTGLTLGCIYTVLWQYAFDTMKIHPITLLAWGTLYASLFYVTSPLLTLWPVAGDARSLSDVWQNEVDGLRCVFNVHPLPADCVHTQPVWPAVIFFGLTSVALDMVQVTFVAVDSAFFLIVADAIATPITAGCFSLCFLVGEDLCSPITWYTGTAIGGTVVGMLLYKKDELLEAWSDTRSAFKK